MTTEIAVINRLGVALAADSAVTISGFGVEKVFDTGDKLFELSASHPVGIMVNGNLDFLGVPWELIIKDFRNAVPNPAPASIEGWSLAFIDFASKHRAVNFEQSNLFIERFFDGRISHLQQRVLTQIQNILDKTRRNINKSTIAEILDSELEARTFELENLTVLRSMSGFTEDQLDKKLGPRIVRTARAKFGKGGLSNKSTKALRRVLIKELLLTMDDDTRTGLVICGFGGDDLFPSLHAVSIDGVLFDKLRFDVTHDVEITRDETPGDRAKELGTAISFAQTDVIDRLLRGGDERLVKGSERFVERSVGKGLAGVFDQLGWVLNDSSGAPVPVNEMTTFLSEKLPALYREYAARIGDEIEREFKQTISLMPKQELIELAEALVSITAVERKATRDAGTVGGPIDVALITRSEGFVWIKRKHYFSAELNPRYLSRVNGYSTGGEAR